MVIQLVNTYYDYIIMYSRMGMKNSRTYILVTWVMKWQIYCHKSEIGKTHYMLTFSKEFTIQYARVSEHNDVC
jgi:hypothetical protein